MKVIIMHRTLQLYIIKNIDLSQYKVIQKIYNDEPYYILSKN